MLASVGGFTPFSYRETISSADINSIFDSYCYKSISPRLGLNLSITSERINMGTNNTRWNSVFFSRAFVYDSMRYTRCLINSPTVTADAASVSIDGLNGKTDIMYEICAFIKIDGSCALDLYFNDDTATNYVSNYIYNYESTGSDFILPNDIYTNTSINLLSDANVHRLLQADASFMFHAFIFANNSFIKPMILWDYSVCGQTVSSGSGLTDPRYTSAKGGTLYNIPSSKDSGNKGIERITFEFSLFPGNNYIQQNSEIQIFAYRGNVL